ncbi:hypothetical protein PTTG_26604 [Puccinia triticina 1-1 BBBD Race 1]|uniref:Peptidase A2 domain-containing protein n=1 Tax=Puccinia triticina (isolate 1-1 / race 1 (BBBD)) TaxID=630390 RepID=A0A180GUF4_PUCT1|nr:hypothetical protein PTTG_26604 [Puccinia triticina 1-1 BBBD Race 1]
MEASQSSGSSRKMVKIKPQDRGLKFTGTRVEAFLRQYELAANLDGASDEDKVLQIPSFLGSEDIQDAVWDMSGYATKSWATLRKQMIERWGQVDAVRYTVADLQALKDSWSAKGGISTLDAYRSFKSVFDVILSYLIRYQHLSLEDLAVDHFFFAFSSGFQQRIKSYLVKEKKMVKTLDGRYRLPVLSELRAAVKSEMEEEVAFTSEPIKPEPVAAPKSEFKTANDIMQKMEDDRRPKEAPVSDKAPATVDEISKMLQSFEQRLEKKFVMKGAPSTPGAPRESRGPLVCYYCHREGHGTGRCMELVKDKEANLVEQKGNNFFLPNGALIPATCGSLEPWYPPAVSSQSFAGTYEADPARRKHEAPKPFKAPIVPPSAGRKPVKKTTTPHEDSDAEDMDEEPELFERSSVTPMADPVPLSAGAPESTSKSKPPVQKVRFERAISKDQPHIIDDMIKKVSDLPVPGVTIRELLAISPAMAEGWKKWVTKRRVEAGTEELRTASGTLLAEGPDPEGPGSDSRLYSCPLGFLPCLVGEEESSASPMIDSGSQLNLISNALANKFNISPRVNFSSAVWGIGNQSCELMGVAEDVQIRVGRTIVGSCHFWITRADGPLILGRPFLIDFEATLIYSGQGGEKIVLPDPEGRQIEISLCATDQGRWERDFPGKGKKAVLSRMAVVQDDSDEESHFL